ncbi:unnamed protein product [Bemisia tabaci]|uniref:Amidase domain-containing protein n=1 Tax=Bemisia tabaci TaxID=7038 RepID=A0A9P0F219_BEMTA|nr:unnamed protein product [Bemisia tabaci]
MVMPEELSQLHYVEMIIKETLRLFSVPATGRKITEDLRVNDKFKIPAGVDVWLSIYAIHHDAELWERPGEFYPEHFTSAKEKSRPKGAFIPFLSGPRICPGMRFSVGCTLRDGMKAMENGAAVEKLVKAGAIPILVSNTPELCCSIETYNFITGRTNNPYNRFRTSGGSSGGEAALLGSGASVIGIGSDMGGSIRVPAMFNGVYGHKPTPGIIDLTGHFPLDPSPDFQKVLCIGPMTRYAEDLTPMFKILAGDKASSLNLDHKVPVNNLNVFYLDNCGYPLGNNQPTREIKKKIHQAVNHFKSKSCKCEKADLPEWDDSTEISLASFFGSILKSVNKTLNNMSIKFSLPHEAVKFILGAPTFTLATIHFTALLTFKAFIPKKRREMYVVEAETLKKKLTNLLKDNGVLLCPTSAQPAFYHGLFPLKQTLTCQAFLFNILHLPATNVPLGLNSQGLPIGLQVVAGPGQDKLCFQVAEELEAAFGGWVPPPSSY